MTVRIYYGIDGGAPILTSAVGSLRDILTACLVDGYGEKEGAGWSVAFNGTNETAYLQGKLSGNKVLHVDDNLIGAPNVSRMRGYSSMESLSVGENPFPNPGQTGEGVVLYKSATLDEEMRNWTLLANESTFYLQINATSTFNSTNSIMYAFGDFESYKDSDQHNCLILGSTSSSEKGLDRFGTLFGISSTLAGHYLERSYTTIVNSAPFGKHWDSDKDGCIFPNPVDGSILISPIWITELDVLRGKMKGVYKILHDADYFNHGDTFSGSGDYSGKLFQVMRCQSGKAFAFEVSDTW